MQEKKRLAEDVDEDEANKRTKVDLIVEDTSTLPEQTKTATAVNQDQMEVESSVNVQDEPNLKSAASSSMEVNPDGKIPKRKPYRDDHTERNPNTASIELELFKALAASGIVSADNAMDPNKLSADVVRVTNSFNAKNQCDSRVYEYLLPTYILANAPSDLYPHSLAAKEAGNPDMPNDRDGKTGIKDPEFRKSFRLSETKLQHLKDILKAYEGTFNYHNFTFNIKFDDKNAKRFIKSFECSEPFVREEIEWVTLTVHGQAFMLHQIRKMVGLAIMMLRTKTPLTLVRKTFDRLKLNIPKAPSLGLMLRHPMFGAYNKQNKNRNDRDNLDFTKYKDVIDPFVEQWIHANMIKEEVEGFVFDKWTSFVDNHSSQFQWWLTEDGNIREEESQAMSGMKEVEDEDDDE
ncbi:tRNA pseudouridine synthase 1 [Blyttiomyces sp. JEL0837]|nr:tRNA pseudouridine synthase 1 [Blyttiomyces sp. JEL0837]